MTDYTKLVKALRCCGEYAFCNDCPIFETCDGDVDKAMAIAADAIEALYHQTDILVNAVKLLTEGRERLLSQLPKRGEWINSKERIRPDMCSVCGCVYEADRFMDKIAWNYCPNCGAKMEVQE